MKVSGFAFVLVVATVWLPGMAVGASSLEEPAWLLAQERSVALEDQERWGQLRPEAREAAFPRARAGTLFDAWTRNGDAWAGNFVSFRFDEATGVVHSFRVRSNASDDRGTEVFARIRVAPSLSGGGVLAAGPIFRYLAEAGSFSIHNTPQGFLSVKSGAEPLIVTLEVAKGVSYAQTIPLGAAAAVITPNGLYSYVVVAGQGSVKTNATRVHVELYPNSSLFFLANPNLHYLGKRTYQHLYVGAGYGRVQSINAFVGVPDGGVAQARLPLGTVVDVESASADVVRLRVQLGKQGGPVAVVLFDQETMPVAMAEEFHVWMDGTEAKPYPNIAQLLGAATVVNSYAVEIQDYGVQVALHLPFNATSSVVLSTKNATTVEELTEAPAEAPGLGPEAAVVVALAAAFAWRRRR